MVIPNKRLIIVNETLKKTTYPFGNCGYITMESNTGKVRGSYMTGRLTKP
jgi:hypothetical protein